ncbi:MAG: hypothetical protein F6K16_41010 [Symploca sp. SIO2B6]|nr:hypothetical protein [Symploca sp. SIO2B6]
MKDATTTMAAIDCCDRWQVYFRLKALGIPCQCGGYQPLLADIQTPYALIQAWSVVKQVSTPRLELAQWLEQCWHLSR